MKLKYLLISLIMLNNCYSEEYVPLFVITTVPTTAPTTYTEDITHNSTVSRKTQRKKEISEFIEKSYDTLEIEIAKGEGPYLNQLLDLTEPEDREKTIESYRKKIDSLIKKYGTIKEHKINAFALFIIEKE